MSSSRQGMDLRRMIWKSSVFCQVHILPCLFLHQLLLRLLHLECNHFLCLLRILLICGTSISPDYLPSLMFKVQLNSTTANLYLHFFFLWLEREGNFWMSHLCQLPSVANWLMWLSLSKYPRTACQKNLDCWKMSLRSITVIITSAWSDPPSHSGLLCLPQVTGFWAQTAEPTVTLSCPRDESTTLCMTRTNLKLVLGCSLTFCKTYLQTDILFCQAPSSG